MIVMGNVNVNEVSVNNVNKAEMEEQGRIAKGQMTALTHYNEEDVCESLVAPLTQYDREEGEQWETVKTCSPVEEETAMMSAYDPAWRFHHHSMRPPKSQPYRL